MKLDIDKLKSMILECLDNIEDPDDWEFRTDDPDLQHLVGYSPWQVAEEIRNDTKNGDLLIRIFIENGLSQVLNIKYYD
jgi:hypothetical protein